MSPSNGPAPELGRSERLRDWVGRRLGEIKRRLPFLTQLGASAVALIAAVFAPAVDAQHHADRLQAFFGVAVGVIVAVLVGVGLLQVSSARPWRVLRYLSGRTFILLAIGAAAASVGLITVLDTWMYRYLFGATVGCGSYAIALSLIVAAISMNQQRERVRNERADALSAPSHAPKHATKPDRPDRGGES